MEQYPEPVPAHQNLTVAEAEGEARLPARLRFRRGPLAFAALAFACGILLARWLYQPASVLLAAALVLLVLTGIALVKAPRTAALPALALWLVLGLCASEWPPLPRPTSTLAPFADGLSREVEATVTRVRTLSPEAEPADADAAHPWETTELLPETQGRQVVSLDLAVTSIEEVTPDEARMVAAQGGVRLTLYSADTEETGAAASGFRCGDRVRLSLRLHPFERFRDPGVWQYADYLAGQGIDARATSSFTASSASVERTGGSPPLWTCRLQAAQTWAASRLSRYTVSRQNQTLPHALRLSQSDAGMVAAMLFGDRTGLDHTLRTAFERTGTFHLFVVSGLHVALLAAVVFFITRQLRAPDWMATLITVPVATVYAVFTGFGAPVQRSLVMVTVYLVARLLSRKRDSLNALGAAVLLMLLWIPASLFETGFQMTLLAVIGIAGLAHPLAQRRLGGYAEAARQVFAPRRHTLPPRLAQLRLTLEILGEALAAAITVAPAHPVRKAPALLLRGCLALTELLLIGTVAELVMVLPMALYFHRATPFALPANMLIIPLIGILAPAAVLAFAASLVSPVLAMVPGSLLALLLHGVTAGVSHLSRQGPQGIPVGDLRVPGPAFPVALLAVVLWLAGCWAVRRSRTGALITACLLPLIAVVLLWPEPVLRVPGTLEVTAIDVGQGDSLLVMNPSGASMLVDAGGPVGSYRVTQAESRFDVGEEVVSAYLWSRRIRRLDVVVLSHAHSDHMGGMPAVLENFRPRELWVGIDPQSTGYRRLLTEAASLGIAVRHFHAGEHTVWHGVGVDVLAPDATYANSGAPKNDDSLVLGLQYGKASALLEGDAERPSEQAMLAAGRVHPVTLLKVGHHGSNTSSTPAFLESAMPRTAMISSGLGNPFGHPRAEVIARFATLGIPLLRTDHEGLSTVLLLPDGRFCEGVQGTLFAGCEGLPAARKSAWWGSQAEEADARH